MLIDFFLTLKKSGIKTTLKELLDLIIIETDLETEEKRIINIHK